MPDMTPTQRLADHMLGGKLQDYVLSRRAKGDSWRRISLSLRDDTGLDVTHQTLCNWFDDLSRAA